MKRLLFIIILIPLTIAFGQSDDELLKKIRQDYYSLQNELSTLKKLVLNDSITYYLKDSAVVKIIFRKGVINEEFYYFKKYTSPYFVFSKVENKENRYYFDSYEDDNYFRMFKWLDHNKKERSKEDSDFKSINNEYFFRGKNLKSICENNVTTVQSIYIKQLVDSLTSLDYKLVFKKPFRESIDTLELLLVDDAEYKLKDKSGNANLYVTLSYNDCAGGGSTIRYIYTLPNNRLVEIINGCRGSLGESKHSYCYKLIQYNDGHNSYKNELTYPYEDYNVESWNYENIQLK